MGEPPQRKLASWINSYREFMKPMEVPDFYAEWSAVAAISGALERRCYVHTIKGILYPNLYVWLVGYPGTGKSQAIKYVAQLWNETGMLNTASESITGKGLFDEMLETTGVGKIDVKNQIWHDFASLLVALPEFGTFLTAYDTTLINFLNDLYDCGPHLRDRTRGGGFKEIKKPHLVILAGTQPAYIASIFPKEAFELGLTSRTVMAWTDDNPKPGKIFGRRSQADVKFPDLLHDLRLVATVSGEFTFDNVAGEIVQDWIDNGKKPVPTHPKLNHYNTRRLVNLLKLCMCISASETDTLIVDSDHVIAALDLLLRTEENIPRIFTAMTMTEHAHDLHEIAEKIEAIAEKHPDKQVNRQQLVLLLSMHMPRHYVMATLGILEETILDQVMPGFYKMRK